MRKSCTRGSSQSDALDHKAENRQNGGRPVRPRRRSERQTGKKCRTAQKRPGKQEKGPRALLRTETPCMSGTAYPPTDCTAVLSAMGSLTAGFGMGPGDPPLHGSAHAGRSPARGKVSRFQSRGHPGGCMALSEPFSLISDREDESR